MFGTVSLGGLAWRPSASREATKALQVVYKAPRPPRTEATVWPDTTRQISDTINRSKQAASRQQAAAIRPTPSLKTRRCPAAAAASPRLRWPSSCPACCLSCSCLLCSCVRCVSGRCSCVLCALALCLSVSVSIPSQGAVFVCVCVKTEVRCKSTSGAQVELNCPMWQFAISRGAPRDVARCCSRSRVVFGWTSGALQVHFGLQMAAFVASMNRDRSGTSPVCCLVDRAWSSGGLMCTSGALRFVNGGFRCLK